MSVLKYKDPTTGEYKAVIGGGGGGGGVGSTEPSYEVILPETKITFDTMSSYAFGDTFPGLVKGQTYVVTWDGTRYEKIAETIVSPLNGATFLYVGNPEYLGGTDTGEPFLICEDPANGWGMLSFEGTKNTATVKIETLSLGQPDWNQNDPTASDYIKNRPFYSEWVELIPETNAQFELIDGMVAYVREVDFNLEQGKSYRLTLGGETYERAAVGTNGVVLIGNAVVVGGADTGESFAVMTGDGVFVVVSLVLTEPTILSLKLERNDIIKKLDPRFCVTPVFYLKVVSTKESEAVFPEDYKTTVSPSDILEAISLGRYIVAVVEDNYLPMTQCSPTGERVEFERATRYVDYKYLQLEYNTDTGEYDLSGQ